MDFMFRLAGKTRNKSLHFRCIKTINKVAHKYEISVRLDDTFLAELQPQPERVCDKCWSPEISEAVL